MASSSRHRLLHVLLVVALLFSIAGHAVKLDVDEENLEALDIPELQQRLSDLNPGKTINFDDYRTKKSLIEVIEYSRNRIKDEAEFEAKVKEAAERRSAGGGDHLHLVVIHAGARSNFVLKTDTYRDMLRETMPNYDDIDLTVKTYDFGTQQPALGRYLRIIGYVCLFLAIAGEWMPFPEAVKSFVRSRRMMLVSTSMMLSVSSNTAGKVDACEILVDNRLVYSGVEKRKIPTKPELRRILLEATLLLDYGAE